MTAFYTPKLIKHQDYIAPDLAEDYATVSEDELKELAKNFFSTANYEKRKRAGLVKAYDKTTQASELTQCHGLITKGSQDAMCYNSAAESSTRGVALMIGVMGFVAFSYMSYVFSSVYTDKIYSAIDYIFWLAPPLFFAFSIGLLFWTGRHELFQPIDEPLIFDRKHRKIYRIFRDVHRGLKGLFKPWAICACEYDWDLICAEHMVEIKTSANGVSRSHSLIITVKKSHDNPIILDNFQIATPLFYVTDVGVDATYEHIRRFMEDNGPLLPYGTSLPEPSPRLGLISKIKRLMPTHPYYQGLWKTYPIALFLLHLILPITLTIGGLWLVCNWLSVKTATPIAWPQEVIDAVGPDVAAPITNETV